MTIGNVSADVEGPPALCACARRPKCCVPLHLGCFQDKIFPCMMTSGLYLEFDLAPAERVIKQLDSVSAYTRLKLSPVFQGKNATGDSWGNDGTNRGVYGFR